MPYVSDLLTAAAASVTGTPTPTRSWQWLRGSTLISGATSSTYTVSEDDIGSTISVRQIESNIAGVDTATSAATAAVQAFDPIALFQNSEEGAWYDPSDLTTLYQDSAGTTPVTAAGQPVGLMLDKSQGLTLGSELVTNGTFDGDSSTGWTLVTGATVSGEKLVLNDPVSNVVSSYVPVAGKSYQWTLTVSDYASGSLYFYVGGQTRLIASANGTYTGIAVSNAAVSVRILATGDPVLSVDNISVKELPGNHATQSTSTARPTLQTSGGLYYLDFDGVDDGMTTAAVDFSVTENATLFAAVDKQTEPANQTIVELGLTTSSQGMFTLTGKSGLAKYAAGSRGTALGFATTTDAAFAAPSKNVVSGLVSITGNLAELRLDGTSVAIDTTDQGDRAYLNGAINIMARNNASANWLDGHLYGLIIRGASSTTAEIEATESYLATKSGVTLP